MSQSIWLQRVGHDLETEQHIGVVILLLGTSLVAQTVKASAYNAGDLGSIPGSGRSPGEGKGYPLQYSGLENSMDCMVHGVAKSRTQLNDFHFTFRADLNGKITCSERCTMVISTGPVLMEIISTDLNRSPMVLPINQLCSLTSSPL